MKEHSIHEGTGRPYLWVRSSGPTIMSKLYRLEHKLQPYLCKIGVHDAWDIGEIDGSVIVGYCDTCKTLTKPNKAMPPDPQAVAESEKWDDFDFTCCCEGECKNRPEGKEQA